MPSSQLFDFYRLAGGDHRGRSLAAIRRFALDELERQHDYIQWLFPLPEGSGVLAQAPKLTNSDIEAFRSDPSLTAELRRSLELMLGFYGLALSGGDDPMVDLGPDFTERAANPAPPSGTEQSEGTERRGHLTRPHPDGVPPWLHPGNHNHLRLTRILRSCTLLGLAKEARALEKCLEGIAAAHPGEVTEETLGFWRGAVEG